jgi:hypothetical protein
LKNGLKEWGMPKAMLVLVLLPSNANATSNSSEVQCCQECPAQALNWLFDSGNVCFGNGDCFSLAFSMIARASGFLNNFIGQGSIL